ncbi:MAG: DUF72 domain-containing protein [Desulfurococcaceae archaeon]
MEIFVGTSGWLYDWNEEATLEWYVRESGLNAVELNASFYRFPFRNQVKSWARKGRRLRWSIKVHRSITHLRKMGDRAIDIWWKFHELFKPMDNIIDFYLFQLPPTFTCKEENLGKISTFNKETRLDNRMAIEFRHSSCFNDRVLEWAIKEGITIVSIDAPIAYWIVKNNDLIYLRMHGREAWYGYEYNEKELEKIAMDIFNLKPNKVYVFLNNDHWMLENARYMKKVLEITMSRSGSL